MIFYIFCTGQAGPNPFRRRIKDPSTWSRKVQTHRRAFRTMHSVCWQWVFLFVDIHIISHLLCLKQCDSEEIESFSGTVHVLVEVLDSQAKRIEHAKLKVFLFVLGCFPIYCCLIFSTCQFAWSGNWAAQLGRIRNRKSWEQKEISPGPDKWENGRAWKAQQAISKSDGTWSGTAGPDWKAY